MEKRFKKLYGTGAMKIIFKYLKIWLKLTTIASQTAFTSRFGAIIFILAKIFRFIFFLLFIMILTSKTKTIAGYSFWEIILFYATFNLVDTLTQFLLRETYRFRSYIVAGFFDYILIKPFSALFRSLFGGSDILDLPIIIMSVLFIFFAVTKLEYFSFFNIFIYILLILNAFLIAISFHIFVLCIGILTTEVDNTIMLYRDLTQMGRLPVELYKEPISWIMTFIIPVGIMMSFPAKAVIGTLSPNIVLISLLIGLMFIYLSLKFWKFSLNKYVSASS